MPRKPRFNLIGIPQHVIQRGNNREPCFLAEEDYRRYLDDLGKAAERFGCHIHAYILMTNHVHLLMTPMRDYAISQMMQALGRRYVRYINHAYERTGTLWEGRYKSSLVDSDRYLLTCMRYIELNPVRAGMVSHPGGYKWSSYSANGQGKPDSLVSPHPLYLELGKTEDTRLFAYRELFRNQMANEELHDIRESLNHELVLGRSYFKEKIEKMTKRQTSLGQPGRPKIEEKQADYYVRL